MFTWSHYAESVTSTGTANIYYNAVLQSTCTGMDPAPNVVRANCFIGKSNGGGDRGMSLYVDDFMIFNTALSATSVKSVYLGSY